MKANERILITGGTGYDGGRLIPLLLDRGYRIRTMVRSPQKLVARPWAGHPALDVLPGDALDVTIGQHCVEIRNAAVDEGNLNIFTSNAYPRDKIPDSLSFVQLVGGAGIVVTCVEVHYGCKAFRFIFMTNSSVSKNYKSCCR